MSRFWGVAGANGGNATYPWCGCGKFRFQFSFGWPPLLIFKDCFHSFWLVVEGCSLSVFKGFVLSLLGKKINSFLFFFLRAALSNACFNSV